MTVRRREFIKLLGGATVTWPIAARAQQAAGRVWRVGVLEQIAPALNATNFEALRNGLAVLGYVEGQNLIVEYRSADGRIERFPELAAELVRLKVDVLLTRGTPAVLAAKAATATIPIVMTASGGPLETGVVAGLARPGGNVTGLSAITGELIGKRFELLTEGLPSLRRIAFLQNMANPVAPSQWEELKAIAKSRGVEVQLLDVRKPEDVESAINAANRQSAALVVGNDSVTHASRQQIIELAAKHQLAAIYAAREFVDAGGLMSYAVSYLDSYRRAAVFVDKIFKGAKPSELPVEQPTKFELVVNLKSAKVLGLTIPLTLIARADELIE